MNTEQADGSAAQKSAPPILVRPVRLIYRHPDRGPVEVRTIRMCPGINGNLGFYRVRLEGMGDEITIHRDGLDLTR